MNEIPQHLQEGHKAFTEWRDARTRAGIPLPPGAVFILNKQTVLKDALGRYRLAVAKRLLMPISCVKLDFDYDDAGRMRPITDVDPPDGWLKAWTGKNEGGTRVEDFAREHIQRVIREEYLLLQANLPGRLQGLQVGRPDLMQKTEDALGA